MAIVRDVDAFYGVMVRRKGQRCDVLGVLRGERGCGQWQEFAEKANAWARGIDEHCRDSVLGFDAGHVGFYRISLPAAGDQELDAMVALQAESLLPLPVEQMKLAWRGDIVEPGKLGVTIAASRLEVVLGFWRQVQECEHGRVLIESEGVVSAWRGLFGEAGGKDGVVVAIGRGKTHICLVRDGQLVLGVVSEVGRDDLAGEAGKQYAEQLGQDVLGALERFADAGGGSGSGIGDGLSNGIYVLSDGGSLIGQAVEHLGQMGLGVQEVVLNGDGEAVGCGEGVAIEDVFECLVGVGLAMIGNTGDGDSALDLFAGMLGGQGDLCSRSRWVWPLKVTAPIAAGLLVVLLVVWYCCDVARCRATAEALAKINSGSDVKVKKDIAARRVNVLELIGDIQECEVEGIMLDSIAFRRGQPVSVVGHTKEAKNVRQFQKKLVDHRDIKEPRPQGIHEDKKKKETRFTMKFRYKNYCKKVKDGRYR